MTDSEIAILARRMQEALAGVDRLSSLPTSSVDELRARIATAFDFSRPRELAAVIEETADLLRDGTVHTPSPRYFGLFNPAVTDGAVAGDALVAAFNPQLAAYSHAPGAQEIERHALREIAKRMGLPDETLGHFTSGGSEANQTGVLLALTRAFPAFGEDGAAALSGPARMYVSEVAHDSFSKIAHTVGIGRKAVRKIPVDLDLRLDLAALRAAIVEDRAARAVPFLVVGTAGTTAAGAIDPLFEIAEIARQEGLWFHADAAWGGGAAVSDRHRHLLEGIELADSVTFDAHKWLSVPMGAGMLFTRHPSLLAETFRVSAGYMPARTDQGLDPFVSTIQWSRRSIGMKVATSLASLGWPGYERMIDLQFDLGKELRTRLTEAGWTIKNRTELPLVCFSHPRIEAGEVTLEQVLERVYALNTVWISIAPLARNEHALRACITSIHTRSEDLATLVQVCEQALVE